MKPKILAQGAEAKIISNGDYIIKSRIKKVYRIKELDEKIRKRRTKSETKLLEKASKIIPVPVPEKTKKNFQIRIPFIEGKKLSQELDSFTKKEQLQILKQIGENTAKLHNIDIIHGDLTTSNMILKDNLVFFIDFGLGYSSHKIEDKAVDLHLIKEALEAKHFQNWEELFNSFLKGYKKYKKSKEVLDRLRKVEQRGRYKDKY